MSSVQATKEKYDNPKHPRTVLIEQNYARLVKNLERTK